MITLILSFVVRTKSASRGLLFARYSIAVMVLAGLGGIFNSHDASATFFAARGETLVSGVDRTTGLQKNLTDRIYAFPGDVVQFRSSVWNGGDIGYKTDVTIKNIYFDTTESNGTALKPHALVVKDVQYADRLIEEPLVIAGAALIYRYGYPQSAQHWTPPSVTLNGPGSSTPGKQFCQYATVSVGGYNIIPWAGSYPGFPFIPYGPVSFKDRMACAEIAYNYNLMPTITLNNSSEVRAGKVPNVTAKVQQGTLAAGGATYSQSTQWQITKVVLKAGAIKPNPDGGVSNQLPCNGTSAAYFKPTAGANTGVSCEIVAKSGTTSEPKNTIFNEDGSFKSGSSLPALLSSVVGLEQNEIVCYALSVNAYAPYLTTGAVWRHSPLTCTSGGVSKMPKVQIHGDDLRVGGKITTSLSLGLESSIPKIYGSWSEYGSYSTGVTANYATASGLEGGIAEGASQASWSKLTFANKLGNFGSFSPAKSLNNTEKTKEYLTRSTQNLPGSQTSINLASLPGDKRPYKVNNGTVPVEIHGGTIAKGKTIVIIATGKVVIKDDIRYTNDPLTSMKDIPQVVIIAKDISIAEEVKNVDAWLIADEKEGTIDTCSPRQAPSQNLTANICKDQLRVNGAVLTARLLLNRTAGSDVDTPGAPAEVFNGRPDAYLWAMQYDTNQRRAVTTYQVELPPRF